MRSTRPPHAELMPASWMVCPTTMRAAPGSSRSASSSAPQSHRRSSSAFASPGVRVQGRHGLVFMRCIWMLRLTMACVCITGSAAPPLVAADAALLITIYLWGCRMWESCFFEVVWQTTLQLLSQVAGSRPAVNVANLVQIVYTLHGTHMSSS